MRLVLTHTVTIAIDVPDELDAKHVARRMADSMSVALSHGGFCSDLISLAKMDEIPLHIHSLISRPVVS